MLPYVIFWFIYIYSISEILYAYFFKSYKIIYYPVENESFMINFFIILPKRLAFEGIYYFDGNFFTSKNFITLIKILSIVLFIGLPYILLKILNNYIITGNLRKTWNIISPYKNLKLLIIDGKKIRNMKKISDHAKNLREGIDLAKKLNNHSGLLQIEKGTHAVSYKEDDNIGVTFTSKIQKNSQNMEVIQLNNNGKTIAYAQIFDNNNKFIPLNKIENHDLREILNKNGIISSLGASKLVYQSNEEYIIKNIKNKQEIAKITFKDKEKCKLVLNKCGGIDKVDNYFKSHQIIAHTCEELKKFVYAMENSSKEEKIKLIQKHKNLINNVEELDRNGLIEKNDSFYLLKSKMEFYIDNII